MTIVQGCDLKRARDRVRPGIFCDLMVDAELDGWARNQVACWQGSGLNAADVVQRFSALNENCPEFFILDVRDGAVTIREKKSFFDNVASAASANQVAARAVLYQVLLQHALAAHSLALTTTIGLDVADFVADRDLPVFSFQKPAHSKNMLLPDVDFLARDWYAGPLLESGKPVHDAPFRAKLNSAIFAGASTGHNVPLTCADILGMATPRLYYANRLHGHPRISFNICSAVQCDSPESKALLEAQRYFSAPISYEEQFRHKFIISIDGNGATCSRVVIALKSNSVLLKFASPHRLYYFDGLIAGKHYVSVSDSYDIERVLAEEDSSPGLYQGVAEDGKAFCDRYLTVDAGRLYVAKLLNAYRECLEF